MRRQTNNKQIKSNKNFAVMPAKSKNLNKEKKFQFKLLR